MSSAVPSSAKKAGSAQLLKTPSRGGGAHPIPSTPATPGLRINNNIPNTPNTPSMAGLQHKKSEAGHLEGDMIRIANMFFKDGKENEWDVRVQAMQAIVKLASAENLRSDRFEALLNKHVAQPLIKQLADLRSQIVKEACKTVSELVVKLGDGHCDKLVQMALPGLYSNLIKTKKVFSDSANICIFSIVKSCRFSVVAKSILEACGDKHAFLRERAIEYLYMAILKYSTAIESQVDLADIEVCLRVRLGDPTPQTREFSRKITDLLMKLFPERATAFFSSLDPAIQKQLQKVAPTAAAKPAPAVSAPKPASQLETTPAPATAKDEIKAPSSAVKRPTGTMSKSSSQFREFLRAQSAAKLSGASSSNDFFVDLSKPTAVAAEPAPESIPTSSEVIAAPIAIVAEPVVEAAAEVETAPHTAITVIEEEKASPISDSTPEQPVVTSVAALNSDSEPELGLEIDPEIDAMLDNAPITPAKYNRVSILSEFTDASFSIGASPIRLSIARPSIPSTPATAPASAPLISLDISIASPVKQDAIATADELATLLAGTDFLLPVEEPKLTEESAQIEEVVVIVPEETVTIVEEAEHALEPESTDTDKIMEDTIVESEISTIVSADVEQPTEELAPTDLEQITEKPVEEPEPAEPAYDVTEAERTELGEELESITTENEEPCFTAPIEIIDESTAVSKDMLEATEAQFDNLAEQETAAAEVPVELVIAEAELLDEEHTTEPQVETADAVTEEVPSAEEPHIDSAQDSIPEDAIAETEAFAFEEPAVEPTFEETFIVETGIEESIAVEETAPAEVMGAALVESEAEPASDEIVSKIASIENFADEAQEPRIAEITGDDVTAESVWEVWEGCTASAQTTVDQEVAMVPIDTVVADASERVIEELESPRIEADVADVLTEAPEAPFDESHLEVEPFGTPAELEQSPELDGFNSPKKPSITAFELASPISAVASAENTFNFSIGGDASLESDAEMTLIFSAPSFTKVETTGDLSEPETTQPRISLGAFAASVNLDNSFEEATSVEPTLVLSNIDFGAVERDIAQDSTVTISSLTNEVASQPEEISEQTDVFIIESTPTDEGEPKMSQSEDLVQEVATEVTGQPTEKEFVEEAVTETVAKEPTEESIAEVIEESIAKAIEEPVEELVEEPAEESIEEPTAEAIQEPVEEPIEEPTAKAVEEPVGEPIVEAVEELTEEPIKKAIEEAIEGPVEEPIQEPAEELIETVAENPTEEPIAEIIEQSVAKAIEEPVEELVEEPAEESIEEPTEAPSEEPVEELEEEPTEAPIKEPVERPVESVQELVEPSEAPLPLAEDQSGTFDSIVDISLVDDDEDDKTLVFDFVEVASGHTQDLVDEPATNEIAVETESTEAASLAHAESAEQFDETTEPVEEDNCTKPTDVVMDAAENVVVEEAESECAEPMPTAVLEVIEDSSANESAVSESESIPEDEVVASENVEPNNSDVEANDTQDEGSQSVLPSEEFANETEGAKEVSAVSFNENSEAVKEVVYQVEQPEEAETTITSEMVVDSVSSVEQPVEVIDDTDDVVEAATESVSTPVEIKHTEEASVEPACNTTETSEELSQNETDAEDDEKAPREEADTDVSEVADDNDRASDDEVEEEPEEEPEVVKPTRGRPRRAAVTRKSTRAMKTVEAETEEVTKKPVRATRGRKAAPEPEAVEEPVVRRGGRRAAAKDSVPVKEESADKAEDKIVRGRGRRPTKSQLVETTPFVEEPVEETHAELEESAPVVEEIETPAAPVRRGGRRAKAVAAAPKGKTVSIAEPVEPEPEKPIEVEIAPEKPARLTRTRSTKNVKAAPEPEPEPEPTHEEEEEPEPEPEAEIKVRRGGRRAAPVEAPVEKSTLTRSRSTRKVQVQEEPEAEEEKPIEKPAPLSRSRSSRKVQQEKAQESDEEKPAPVRRGRKAAPKATVVESEEFVEEDEAPEPAIEPELVLEPEATKPAPRRGGRRAAAKEEPVEAPVETVKPTRGRPVKKVLVVIDDTDKENVVNKAAPAKKNPAISKIQQGATPLSPVAKRTRRGK